ncbi:hypothetical protein GCM10025771_24690 [Niveibacterium umoris]|uniref:N-acyl amino acid synthase of PEP-CTERM/exosortase system n=1 Tax=Niveibacterium umoris TaxID=1193620 RepID=A0A840BI89_9RHOO|nr:PEP-CTERM/exosortase system-associated acyltransferase [Niveibacterium umoris]MBB4012343.1 N-acyl amino acid synthase of PEP-CTERM/exosortase system [Niveibacterium umoris]
MSAELAQGNLGESFSNYFEILPALDDAVRREAFFVRHEVYCKDLHFEAERDTREETDDYDKHSLHCVLRTRGEHARPVGCARLIRANPDDLEHPLPFEKFCGTVLDRSIVDPSRLPRTAIAEVSRLAVVSDFRRRKDEQDKPVSISDDDFRAAGPVQRFPFIPVSLYLACLAMSIREGIEHVFVLTEPRLALHFARIGFDIQQIGAPIEHRGLRVPSYLRPALIARDLKPMMRPLFDVVQNAIDEAYKAAGL